MNKTLNKFLTLIISGILSLPALTVMAQDDKNDELAYILNAFNISAVSSSDYITRGDFTVLAVQASAEENTKSTEIIFKDTSGEQGEYISYAASMGYVNGVAGDYFHPNEIISLNDAVTIAFRVLGFGQLENDAALKKQIIDNAELYDGITGSKKLSCNDANRLIMNMLEAGYAKYDSTGRVLDAGNEKLMYKAHGIYEVKGTVTGIGSINASGYDMLGKDEILIDNLIYKNKCSLKYESIGTRGTAYIKEAETGDSVIYYQIKERIGKQLLLTSKDINETKGFDKTDSSSDKNNPYVSYYDGKNTKQFGISSNAKIYINEKNTSAVTNSDISPESGTLLLIDMDGNKVAETAIVEKYDYYFVSGIGYDDGKIIDKYEKATIHLYDFNTDDVSIIYNDQSAYITSIINSSILAVKCSYKQDGTIDENYPISIEILNDKIKGSIESYDSSSVTINGSKYDTTEYVKQFLSINKNGILYLGKFGEAIFFENEALNDGHEYGYLSKMTYDASTDEAYMNIFSANGKKHTFTIKSDEKVLYSGIIDGAYTSSRAVKAETMSLLFAESQLVRYKYDGDKLLSVKKAVDNTEKENYDGYDDEHFSLDCKSASARLYSGFITENYKADNTTVLFAVSKNAQSTDDIVIGKYQYFGTDVNNLDVKLYDCTSRFVPGVMFLEYDDVKEAEGKLSDSMALGNYAALIYEKYTSVNEDGEEITKYKAYCGGVSTELEPCRQALKTSQNTNWAGEGILYFEDLKPGDVIQYENDSNGRVRMVHVLYNSTDKSPRYIAYNSTSDYISAMTTAFGKVSSFVKNSYFSLNSMETRKYPYARNTVNVYIFDTAKNTARKELALDYMSEDDFVFVRTSRSDVKDIVVYR